MRSIGLVIRPMLLKLIREFLIASGAISIGWIGSLAIYNQWNRMNEMDWIIFGLTVYLVFLTIGCIVSWILLLRLNKDVDQIATVLQTVVDDFYNDKKSPN